MAAIAPLNTLVRPWKKGAKITEPGIYSGVPMDVYHSADLCDGASVSSSILRLQEEKSPLHAWRQYPGNPDRSPPKDSSGFSLGRAVHHLAGGEKLFGSHFIVRPAVWDSWRTKDAKAWRTEQKGLGFDILDPDDLDVIKGVMGTLNQHPTIQAGILRGLVEHTVVYRDAKTGLWVKTRPDVIPLDSSMIVDLKTCADASRGKVIKSIGEFGYHIQLAMIDEALWQVAGFEATEHVLVFVEKSDPWALNITPISDWAIDYGRRQTRRALDTFAECLKTGEWPGYPDDEVEAGLPDWLNKKLAAEAENSLLPKINGRGERPAPAEAI